MPAVPPARRARFVFLTDVPPGAVDRSNGRAFGWRLLAANNRPLGRGVWLHDTFADCVAAAGAVRDTLSAPESPAMLDATRGRWTWRIVIDGRAAALSVHSYSRRIECSRAFGQFTTAALAARPHEGIVRAFGPASMRLYEPVAGGR